MKVKNMTIGINIAHQTMPYAYDVNLVIESLLCTNGPNFHHNNAGPFRCTMTVASFLIGDMDWIFNDQIHIHFRSK